MYMSNNIAFEFKSNLDEDIEFIINLPKKNKTIIDGFVKDNNNKIITGAFIKLYTVSKIHNSYSLHPLCVTYSDTYGYFLFGPVNIGENYLVEIWFNKKKIKELFINP